jgi:lambda family phage tail tape measure protein
MTSNRTVKFEFLVDADARQIERFHDALKRMGDGAATNVKTLDSLREELQRFASISDKTENGLQAQISALRGAAAGADLTGKQYIKLRTEVSLLEREYKDLTTGIVGIGKAYEQAGRQAEAFDRRAKKIAERQQYLANSGRPASGTTGQPQVARDASGNLIGYPGRMSGYEGTGDMGLGQYGPTEQAFKAANSLKQAQDQILAQNRQYYQQMLEAERSYAAQKDATLNEELRKEQEYAKQLIDTEKAKFNHQLENRVNARTALKQAQDQILTLNQQHYMQMLEAERSSAAQEDAIRNQQFQREQADYKRRADAAVADFNLRLKQREAEKKALQQQIEDERILYRKLIEQRDNAFTRRADKIADRQQYFNTSQGRTGTRDTENRGAAQVQRDASGNLIGYPGRMSGFERMGNMGFGQYGPSEKVFQAVTNLKQAQDQILAQNRQYYQQMLEGERKFAAEEDAIRDRQFKAEQDDYKRRADLTVAAFDRELENRVNRKKQRRSNLREVGNVASNVAIGGFFGGPEGLAGSAAGAFAGSFLGPGGMVAGAQLGASVGLAAQSARLGATAVADMVAQLNLAKTALAQVSANQADYNQKLEFSRQVSTDYSVGLQATIDGYSKVTAAAAANGLTLKETETIYRGLLASGVAFGASQDDLQSIIIATTQILSKGKISAEELSGQLGERIPGAVAKFAQATGRPLAQLAKDLQDGKVNIADFVKFAEGQLNDYDKSAKLIGSSPEKAGERLNLALTRMAESYGGFFQSVGAGFQDFATKFINWINSQSQGIKTMVGLLNWAGRENYKFVTNTPAVRAFQSLTSQLSGSQQVRPPAGFARNPADPYGTSTTPFIQAPVFGRAPKAPESNFFADRLAEGNRLFPEFKPTLFNQNTSAPILGDLTAADDKAAKKAAKAADTAARKAQAEADRATQLQEKLDSEQRRREELLANNAIRLADQVFQHRIDLLRQEYDLKQQLVEATRSAEEAGMTGVARNMQGTINQILSLYDRVKQGGLNDLLDLRQADQRITTERKSAQNTARYADVPQSAVGMPIRSSGGVFALTGGRPGSPNAGQSTEEHLDVRWADRRRISAADADRFFEVNGRAPSSFGVTSGYGPRSLFGRSFHAGIDFGTPEGGRLSLKNGATFAGMMSPAESGGGGLTGIINTPMGQMKVLHLEKILTKATPGTTQARTQPGVAQGINRNIVDTGSTDIATADKAALVAKQKQESQLLFQITEKQAEALIKNTTTSYRDQTQALQDQLQEFRERNRLQMEGVKPEIIDQQMQLNKLTRDYARESETLSSALKSIGERNKDNASLFDTLTNGLKNLTAAYDENRQSQEALNKAQNDERNVFSFDKSARAGIDGYIESIGTLNGATSNLVQSGFNGISTALKELQSTGSADFRKFALGLISDMQDVITQQFIVANLAKLLRGLFGGAGPVQFPGGGGTDFVGAMNMPKLFANGGVMTSNGPLKLQTYARGGIADKPQLALFGEGSRPEAFVPLPDGRRIPVALSYPAIPGTSGGSGGDGAEGTDTVINNAGKFERTDSMVTRMIESARQESAGNATAAAIAANGGGVVKVQVESTVINGVEYVTIDQAQSIAEAASARSTARHDAALRNNPAERRRRGF